MKQGVKTMTEEQNVVDAEQVEETTEEIKVQVQDLIQAVKDILQEGTARRVVIFRNDRVLVDIPLVAGMAASLVLAIYLPVLSAIVAVGALFGGVTLRVEREEPAEPADEA
jgi:hypothetical protein